MRMSCESRWRRGRAKAKAYNSLSEVAPDSDQEDEELQRYLQ
jgi:hypothetical protein